MYEKLNVNCINGQCQNCGECCGATPIPFTMKEYKTIKRYIKKHNIKETPPTIIDNNVRLECAFRDVENKKCKIYEVRPEMCRVFKCDNDISKIDCDKRRIHKKAYFNWMNEKNEVWNITNFSHIFYDNLYPLAQYLYHYIKNEKIDPKKWLITYLGKYGYKGKK